MSEICRPALQVETKGILFPQALGGSGDRKRFHAQVNFPGKEAPVNMENTYCTR